MAYTSYVKESRKPRVRRKTVVIVGTLLFLTFAILAFSLFRTMVNVPKYSGPVEKVLVGVVGDTSALLLLAQEHGYFEDYGLDVELKKYESGAPALAGLIKGSPDVVVGSDFAGVRSSFTTNNFKIIASVAKVDKFEVVARKDRGIATPGDLKGKKLGITKGSAGEFWAGTFLTYNKLAPSDVVLVDLPPNQLTNAIVNGDIDAVLNFEPHVFNTKKRLGDVAVSWLGDSGQGIYSLLYATPDIVKNRPVAVERLMQSLVRAEAYMQANTAEGEGFIVNYFKYDKAYARETLPKFDFRVILDQSLLIAMEEQARWMIERKLTDKTTVPNYLDFVSVEALKRAQPSAVTIF